MSLAATLGRRLPWILSLLPVPLLAQGSDSASTTPQNDSSIVRAVVIERRDVFDPTETGFIPRLANALHIETRAVTVRRELLFRAGDRLALRAGPEGARLLMLGGAAMDGPRFVFWNFVSSSRERIEQAKADWRAGRFGKVPGDEEEFIPLPEERARAEPAARVSDGSPTS